MGFHLILLLALPSTVMLVAQHEHQFDKAATLCVTYQSLSVASRTWACERAGAKFDLSTLFFFFFMAEDDDATGNSTRM